MRRALNWFLNGFALTFAVPSILIIISWNAIPGDRLYGVKTGLEDAALFLTSRTPLASILSVKYTERRFTEADALLSQKGSTLGYALLVEEAKSSRDIILSKSDSGQAQELVNKIDSYQKKLGEKRTAIRSGQVSVPVAHYTPPNSFPAMADQIIPTPYPMPTPIIITRLVTPVATATPIPIVITQAEDSGEVIDDLQTTDDELEKIKADLQRLRDEIRENNARKREIQNEKRNDRGNQKNNEENLPQVPSPQTETPATQPPPPAPTESTEIVPNPTP